MRHVSLVVGLAALLNSASAFAATVSPCQAYVGLAKTSLPAAVSDAAALETLRNAVFDSRALSSLDPAILLKTLGDEALQEEIDNCKNPAAQSEKNYCDVNKVRRLKISLDKGKLRYVNPDRAYVFGKSAPVTMTNAEASSSALRILIGLGMPKAELSARPFVRTLNMAGNDEAGRDPLKPIRTEQHVLVPRLASRLLVLGSEARMTLNSKGEVARMRLTWPDAATSPRLAQSKPRTSDQMAQDIAAKIIESDSSCRGTYKVVRSRVMYAPVAENNPTLEPRVDVGETANPAENPPKYYAPMVVSYVTPADQPENSGVVSPPGLEVITPIFDVPVAAGPASTTGAPNPANADN